MVSPSPDRPPFVVFSHQFRGPRPECYLVNPALKITRSALAEQTPSKEKVWPVLSIPKMTPIAPRKKGGLSSITPVRCHGHAPLQHRGTRKSIVGRRL